MEEGGGISANTKKDREQTLNSFLDFASEVKAQVYTLLIIIALKY